MDPSPSGLKAYLSVKQEALWVPEPVPMIWEGNNLLPLSGSHWRIARLSAPSRSQYNDWYIYLSQLPFNHVSNTGIARFALEKGVLLPVNVYKNSSFLSRKLTQRSIWWVLGWQNL